MKHITTNPARLPYLMMSALMLALTAAGPEDSFMEYLTSQFDKYNANYSIERTYMITDRYVYRPGDDMWFKGFVMSVNPKINSKDFFVRLISDRGEEIIYRRYPVTGNETSGKLVIPRSCIPGKYWLIGYTGWMKNRCPNEAFRKEILVSKYFERRFQVETLFDKLSYRPGDTLTANIRIIDPAGRPVNETSFDYMVENFRKTDIKGSGVTDIKGKSKITFTVPDLEDPMMLTIEIRGRRFSGDFSTIIPSVSDAITIRFYPEGGSIVAGIPCLMAFTATDKYGIPKTVSGDLIDRKGNVLGKAGTSIEGKGHFELIPSNDSLFLSIADRKGKIRKYPLPVAQLHGSVIRYQKAFNDTAHFIIRSADSHMKSTYWIGVLNRKIVWSEKIQFSHEKSIAIPVSSLPSGIMQVTVFSQDYDIIAERLIRISNPQDELRIQMEREQYRNRQRVSLLVEFPEKMIASDLALSVSLGNLAYSPDDATFHDVMASNPCSTSFNYSTLKDDLALLTSDFYPVSWKEILTQAGIKAPYSQQDGLNGIVYDKKDNIAPHAKVRITHFPNFRLYETQTDETGSFRIFFGSDVIDYRLLNIDAYDALGKTSLSTRVDYSYIEELQRTLIDEAEDSEKQRALDLDKYGEPDLVYDLRYGPGKFRKSRTDTRKKYDPYQYANYTDIMDIIQDLAPYRLEDHKIIFLERNRVDSISMPEAIIVVNGALKGTNIEVLKTIIPSDITNINISDASLDVRKYTPLKFSSVIEITTIQGMSRYNQSHLQTGQGILNSEREFYSPDYAIESSYAADNRKTLYWNPKIPISQGNSMVVTFYTSDVKGVFQGHLIGLDKEGNPVEKAFTFQVE